jgi:hypothetical protein
MRLNDLFENKPLNISDLNIGDELLIGKFKNRKATIKGLTKDNLNQPILKTNKGDQKLFKPRIVKLIKS